MNRLTIHACPLCGKTEHEKFMTCKDHYASGEEFDLYKCKNCGFLFTQNFPVEAEIGKYYDTPDYISHTNTRKGIMNKIYHRVRQKMFKEKARIIAKGLPYGSGILLDIGSGTGHFIDYMFHQLNWEAIGLEKNEQAREYARKELKVEVYETMEKVTKSLDDGDPSGLIPINVVTMWHSMEHIEDLNETWKAIDKLLEPEGKLIIAVPNYTSADAQKYGNLWAAYDVPRHLWHFTPETMKKFGEKHGFVLTEQYPMPFDAFYVSMLSEKYKKSLFPFLRGMISGTQAWRKSKKHPELSSSVIYVFRKQQQS